MKSSPKKEQVLSQTYDTQDFQLAATLYALGAKLEAIDRNDPSRCSFVFEDSQDLRRCIEAYWKKQLSIEPQTLLGALKAIKSRLYGDFL